MMAEAMEGGEGEVARGEEGEGEGAEGGGNPWDPTPQYTTGLTVRTSAPSIHPAHTVVRRCIWGYPTQFW